MNESEDVKYLDAESYQGGQKDQLSFKEIIMRHIVKLSGLASKEFTGGYWKDLTKIVGGCAIEDHVYVTDTREDYSNSIDFLHDMLFPYFDEEMIKASEENERAVSKIYQESVYKDDEGKTKLDRQEYRNKKVIIKRRLLRNLSGFLLRQKYLTAKTFEEDV